MKWKHTHGERLIKAGTQTHYQDGMTMGTLYTYITAICLEIINPL